MTKIATPQQKSFYSGDPETPGEDTPSGPPEYDEIL